jgi:hypothetical protein
MDVMGVSSFEIENAAVLTLLCSREACCSRFVGMAMGWHLCIGIILPYSTKGFAGKFG